MLELIDACVKHDIEEVKRLIEGGVDVNYEDFQGYTALHWAVDLGDKDLVEFLLQYGADVNKSNNDGFTPLYLAALNMSKAVVALLIDAGADIHKTDRLGHTPISRAAMRGYKDICKTLVKYIPDAKVYQFNNKQVAILYKDIIQIGCERYNIKYWLDNYKLIGEKHNYTKEEIAAYGRFINRCAKLRGLI